MSLQLAHRDIYCGAKVCRLLGDERKWLERDGSPK